MATETIQLTAHSGRCTFHNEAMSDEPTPLDPSCARCAYRLRTGDWPLAAVTS